MPSDLDRIDAYCAAATGKELDIGVLETLASLSDDEQTATALTIFHTEARTDLPALSAELRQARERINTFEAMLYDMLNWGIEASDDLYRAGYEHGLEIARRLDIAKHKVIDP